MENLAISSSAVLYISGHLGEGGGGDDSGGGGKDDDREYEIYKPTYKTIVLTNLWSLKAFKKDVDIFWKMNLAYKQQAKKLKFNCAQHRPNNVKSF